MAQLYYMLVPKNNCKKEYSRINILQSQTFYNNIKQVCYFHIFPISKIPLISE